MLRINNFFAILLTVVFASIQVALGQDGTVKVHEHYYDNIHLISYPVEEYANRSDEAVKEYHYEFEVFPGGYVSDIHFSYSICQNITAESNGSLTISGPLGEIYEATPYAYQEGPDGDVIEVPVRYEVNGKEAYLVADNYEMTQILTIELRSIRKAGSDEVQPAAPLVVEDNETPFISFMAR